MNFAENFKDFNKPNHKSFVTTYVPSLSYISTTIKAETI